MQTNPYTTNDHTQRTPKTYAFINTDPLERVLDVLRMQYRSPAPSGENWTARCPAHDDVDPSLSIKRGDDGRVLLHCHAGCTPQQVMESMNLRLADLFPEREANVVNTARCDPCASSAPGGGGGFGAGEDGGGLRQMRDAQDPLRLGDSAPPPTGTGEAQEGKAQGSDTLEPSARSALGCYTRRLGVPTMRWDYRDAGGQRVGMIFRWDVRDEQNRERKEIRPIALIDRRWRCGGMPEPRPLYRLPETIMSQGVVLVCEGEKACDAAVACGYAATTSAHGSKGASKSDWSALRGRDVVIVPDLDEPGVAYARQITQLLTGVARSVKTINLRDGWDTLSDGDDLDDALLMCDGDADRMRAVLDGLIEKAEDSEPALSGTGEAQESHATSPVLEPSETALMSERSPCEVTWLEPGRIAMGKVNMLAGDPGLGKSFITLDLAARVSRGEIGTLPDGSPGNTILMSAEDDPDDTLAPRLIAMDADLTRVRLFGGFFDKNGHPMFPELDRDAERLGRWVQAIGGVTLIIIDPISAYMGTVDSHKNSDVRRVLGKLSEVGKSTGATILCVSHLNKDSGNTRQAIYRTMGSLAFTAAARTVQLVTKLPTRDGSDDPSGSEKRVVSMVKNNTGRMLPPRVYTLADGRLVWLDEQVTGDADVFANGHARFISGETKGDRAVEFLERMLGGGAQATRDVFERGAALGLSEKVLRNAKGTLSVHHFKEGKVWYWSMDGKDDTELIRNSIEPSLDYDDNSFI